MPEFSVNLLAVGDGDVPGPELRWMRGFDTWERLTFQVALLRFPGATILVNTGPPDDITELNAGWTSFLGARARLTRTADDFLLPRLAALGVSPEDVTHIILTPLQLYTVGNLLRFPRATVLISRRGWIHFHTTHEHPHDDRDASLPPDVLAHLVGEGWPRVRLLDDEDEVVPGVRTWWCGGHHRASIVVDVDTAAGVAAISDAYFHLANVTENHPIGITENIYESLACYERVRGTASTIVPLYDPANFTRFASGVVA
jgi:hypothetical protein